MPRGPLNPLRLISARFPRYEVSWFDATERLAYYVDTLTCGHQVDVYRHAEDGKKKRHRCPECGKLLAQKKPVRSVKANKKVGAA